MLNILLSFLLITANNSYTEITATAQTPSGNTKELEITQPQNYIQTYQSIPTITPPPQQQSSPPQLSSQKLSTSCFPPLPIIFQSSSVYPKNLNPLDYIDKIENTIYQLGDRLIIIQSIPLKYIKKALTPNIHPTIKHYPTL